jgi:hypothetical protein
MNKEARFVYLLHKRGGTGAVIVQDMNVGDFTRCTYLAVSHLCRGAFSAGMRR